MTRKYTKRKPNAKTNIDNLADIILTSRRDCWDTSYKEITIPNEIVMALSTANLKNVNSSSPVPTVHEAKAMCSIVIPVSASHLRYFDMSKPEKSGRELHEAIESAFSHASVRDFLAKSDNILVRMIFSKNISYTDGHGEFVSAFAMDQIGLLVRIAANIPQYEGKIIMKNREGQTEMVDIEKVSLFS